MFSTNRQTYIYSINNIVAVMPCDIKQIHKDRPYAGLLYFTEGENEFIFEDHTVKVSPGKLLYLPEGCSYRMHKTNSYYLAINFKIQNFYEGDFLHIPQNTQKIEKLFEKSEYIWRTKPTGFYSTCMANIYSILQYMEESQTAYTPDSKIAKLQAGVQYIHRHYTEGTVSIEHLAKICNMSTTYFNRLFKQVYGTSPLSYVCNMKIQRAKELLRSKMYTVEQVAVLSGYSDASFFRREFKKYTNMPPKEYISKYSY